MSYDAYEIESATCLRETEKAILVACEEDERFLEPVWIPKSQVHDDSLVYKKGDEGTLIVTNWFAKQRGWTED